MEFDIFYINKDSNNNYFEFYFSLSLFSGVQA